MTQNQTQSGQKAHSTFAQIVREVVTRNQATISASAAWRLGIAAYEFPRVCRSALEWFPPSTNPLSGDIHGGAVGMSQKPRSPTMFASRIVLRNRLKASCRRR